MESSNSCKYDVETNGKIHYWMGIVGLMIC
jgi:hypothetical protein